MKGAVFRNRPNHRQWFLIFIALSLLYSIKIFYSPVGYESSYTPDTGEFFSSVEESVQAYADKVEQEDDGRFSKISSYGSSFRDRLVSYLPISDHIGAMGIPEYSIKIIAYVFPQFHPIPENDKFWGKNFTEWENVNKQTVNKYGIPILRPSAEVGEYNLLEIATRRRWTQMLHNSSIHGLVYHHYWFGYPVMDQVLRAMLSDGHPDMPFMLSWANEPWTVRWDGLDMADGTLLAQDYGGIEEWRRHFDWMATYFRHKKYIRANGKVQMMIYHPQHIGDLGKKMFDAWRLWAAQDPSIGGMDVIETLIGGDPAASRGPVDALNEFGVRSLGGIDCTQISQNPRMSRVFHRGQLVSWDNTPRHASDGGGDALAFSHPQVWKGCMIQSMSRIKSDPNPLGHENFFFINALNEWGEGNALEPSERWGDGYLRALDEAKEYVDKHVPWQPHLQLQSTKIAQEVKNPSSQVDVCVIIRDHETAYPFQTAWTLMQTIDSLRNMNNPQWRAIVAGVRHEGDDGRRRHRVNLLNAHEPRIAYASVPQGVQELAGDYPADASHATEWVLSHLHEISPSCSKARYLLITNATNVYEPNTFDAIENSTADIIGLNFESRDTMLFGAGEDNQISWNQRCDRFEIDKSRNCMGATRESEVLDLGAVFLNLGKWRFEDVKFPTGTGKPETMVLKDLADKSSWNWERPAVGPSVSCHLFRAESYTRCTRSGRIWVDVPETKDYVPGCYSGHQVQSVFQHGKIPEQWDYPRFDKSPFCLRLSQERYEQVMAGRDMST